MPTPDNIPASAMSLRDHFAGQAMTSLLRTCEEDSLEDVAEEAYRMADAMLQARATQPTSWPRLHTNTDFTTL